ncbi:MAG TPA: exodeoxyribonuclease VII small subunit [Rhodocyclaceae bacterium]|jgi:exodeoxyribonuclease VII small subunit|nr:exodeoxyribonuclease VII small subunit [Rhodocyclaceae bacterium]HRQ46630.1 exodeoxyribonuclease VII small subunit [Rhodocyclaceae bacterium]
MTKQVSSPKSFESAISELEAIVQEMETGSISLEQALERYQRGVGLLKYCQDTLQQAEQRVRQLESGKLVPIDAGTNGEHQS